jgi:thymidine phosphorylase
LVEVHEAIATLEGRGPPDVWQCTRALSIELLLSTGQSANREHAGQQLDTEIASGRALAKFGEMLAAQGGDLDRLPPLSQSHEVPAKKAGYVAAIDTEQLGLAIIELGGGRKVMTDAVDHSVGLEMLVRIGDPVENGQPLLRVFASSEKCNRVRGILGAAVSVSEQPVPSPPLIVDRIA